MVTIDEVIKALSFEEDQCENTYVLDMDDCERVELYKVDDLHAYLRYECDGYVERHFYNGDQIVTFMDFEVTEE